MAKNKLDKIVSLAKRRGFVFPGSDIYGGLANTYDYGPLGVEVLRNIKNLWWEQFVEKRDNIYGLDTNILMNPKVWEASGHTKSFADVLLDCKSCQNRTRADHLIEEYFEEKGEETKVEGINEEKLGEMISEEKIKCPNCGKFNWTKPRHFNILFETQIGIIPGEKNLAYLRGEIAQGMFVNFNNILDTVRPKLPFGIAQQGPAFRNEITLGKFIFRTLQFNLSEFEYFFNPSKKGWERVYEYWREEMWDWTTKALGINKKNLRWREHTQDERSHYSKKTEDIEYKYPFGYKELYGLAYRTDFDLRNHMEKSGVDLRYEDPKTGKKFIPHVVEPSFGMDRSLLAVLIDSYHEEKDKKKRIILRIKPKLAAYKAAVFPLVSNKKQLVKKARDVYKNLLKKYPVVWDERGNIGKRYFSQDEIGTPWCITVDYDTLEDDTITVRERDSAKQERVSIDKLKKYLDNKLTK